jgi:hypothetical protein
VSDISPDVSQYIDLTIFDADPSTLVAAFVVAAQQLLPGWAGVETDTSMVLAEQLAIIISELIFAINRLPGASASTLLQLFGITQGVGTAPTATATFALQDTSGYTVPANTRLQLTLPSVSVIFTTNADLVVAPGSASGTVAITASSNLSAANGIAAGTALVPLDRLGFVNSVSLATSVAGGQDPETNSAWLNRGTTFLQSIVTACAVAAQFTATALLDLADNVFRAFTLDNWNPGGTSAGRTFTDGATATSTTLSSPALANFTSADIGRTVTCTGVPSGTTILTITSPTAVVMSAAATATASGLSVVLGAIVTAGTTEQGFVTVAAIGQGGTLLTSGQKTSLQNILLAKCVAGLAVEIIDPTVNTINVTYTVWQEPGYTSSQVEANIAAALVASPDVGGLGLSTDLWPWQQTLRIFDIATVISTTPGVSYLSSLSAPFGDVTLSGVAPLAALGTITPTVLGP